MASLAESGLDSNAAKAGRLGLFGMPADRWDAGTYAGYQQRPELQASWFLERALSVKRARLAAGDRSFGRDPSTWGEWIADVEEPGERYRGRYQLRLVEARRLLR